MITHFLGNEEVVGYAADFVKRLVDFGPEDFPKVWCPIGASGDKMLREIAKELHKLRPDISDISIVELFYNKSEKSISIGKDNSDSEFKNARVLIIDSSVHSGSSMYAAVQYAVGSGAAHVLTYSLVVKRSSSYFPHYFGVMISDHDRALFQLGRIPNNRLFAGKHKPVGQLRRINSDDVKRKEACLETGVPSIDRITFGDLYYEHRANGADVMLVEDGENIAGFLKIKITPNRALSIDVIANDKEYRGRGIGGLLMRFAETLGRSNRCTHIELWALQNQVLFYERFGFDHSNETIDVGEGEIYSLMRKRLLYHFDLNDY